MFTSARLFVLVVVGVLAASGALFARTNAEAASTWGLLGTWKIDCSKPDSRSDGALQYVVRGGKLFHDREFGSVRDSSEVISATINADGSIELVVKFNSISQTKQYAFIKGSDGRIQAIFNRDVDTDEYSIKDRKITANGNAALWQTRCR